MAFALGALALIEEIERLESIPRRVYLRDRSDAFSLDDHKFIMNFRLDKKSVLELSSTLQPVLPREGLPSHLRVLIALKFFATGCYQNSLAKDLFFGVSQVTTSRCIEAVSRGITDMLLNEIQFPTLDEQQEIKKRFSESKHLPGVIGAIDCMHVPIIPPSENSTYSKEHCYVNRKGVHSINVQFIVDDLLNIRNVNARYPGSVDDTFIWENSGIRDFLSHQYENGDHTSWLVGDSDYILEPWLLTPYTNPEPDTCEFKFNGIHASARDVIYQCKRILISRFRCLHEILHYQPTKAAFIIIACTILHNICNKKNLGTNYEDEVYVEESSSSDNTNDYNEEDIDGDDDDDDYVDPPYTYELPEELIIVANALRDSIALKV